MVLISILNSLNVVIKSWKHSRQYKGLTRFLVGRFFYADAINTLISGLLAVYLVEEAGLTPADSQNILALAIVISIIGGYIFGKAADKYGPRKLILISIFCWIISLSLAIVATEFDQMWLKFEMRCQKSNQFGVFENVQFVSYVDASPVFVVQECAEEVMAKAKMWR